MSTEQSAPEGSERDLATEELTADMVGLSASEVACYEYPSEDEAALREAFCRGAMHFARPEASARINTLEAALDWALELAGQACTNTEHGLDDIARFGRPQYAEMQRSASKNIRAELAKLTARAAIKQGERE